MEGLKIDDVIKLVVEETLKTLEMKYFYRFSVDEKLDVVKTVASPESLNRVLSTPPKEEENGNVKSVTAES